MNHLRTWLIAIVAATLAFGGCGIPVDDSPSVVALPENFVLDPAAAATSTTAAPAPDAGLQDLFFIREGRLISVPRDLGDEVLAQAVFEALIVGPDESERLLSIESRLAPDLVVEAGFLVGTNVLALNFIDTNASTDPTPFLGVEGDLRAQAIAQLVFTGVDFGASGVVFQSNGVWQLVANSRGEVQVIDENGIPVPLTISDFNNITRTTL
jgi:hypothetical protein